MERSAILMNYLEKVIKSSLQGYLFDPPHRPPFIAIDTADGTVIFWLIEDEYVATIPRSIDPDSHYE